MSRTRVELCTVKGRASLHHEGHIADVERRSQGLFSSDPMDALNRWIEFCSWASGLPATAVDTALDLSELGPCVPRPQQVFAIGLNYRDHAVESGLPPPKQPMVFTKFPSCLTGARAPVALTSDTVDWEVELVVVMARRARAVRAEAALEYVAGYCVGQDLSDRGLQFADAPPQFSLSKSAPGFGPIGPWLVADPTYDWRQRTLTCDIDGVRMQTGSTRDMVFGVPELVAYLSLHCTLLPGDLIFTGTPAGVGSGRKPRMYLRPGTVIRSEIDGLGVLENTCTGAAPAQ